MVCFNKIDISVGGWGGERKGEHLDVDILLGIGGIRVGEEPVLREKIGGWGGVVVGEKESEGKRYRSEVWRGCLCLPGTSSQKEGFPTLE